MEATSQEIKALCELEDIDAQLLETSRELAGLPERAVLLEAKTLISQLDARRPAIKQLYDEKLKVLQSHKHEDEQLAAKIDDIHKAIGAAGSDYRKLEQRTKELDGLNRRRGVLANLIAGEQADFDKAAQLLKRCDDALSDAHAKVDANTETFKVKGGELVERENGFKKEKAYYVSQLSEPLKRAYEIAFKNGAGVAIGFLEGSRCGICKHTFEGNRLTEFRKLAPVEKCPFCGRLLFVVD